MSLPVAPSIAEIQVITFRALLGAPRDLLRHLRPILPISPAWTDSCNPIVSTFQLTYCAPAGTYPVIRDESMVWVARTLEHAISYVEWLINSTAIEYLNDYYLIHAAAVSHGNQGLILPGRSGSGKSSLVGRLIADGWRYLSDDVAVIAPWSRHLYPFAKSVRLHEGARDALQEIHPSLKDLPSIKAADGIETWYLRPQSDWLPSEPVPLRYAVLPTFVRGAKTQLQPIRPSEALACILAESFNLQRHGKYAVHDLAKLLGSIRCDTLIFGNLDEAAALLAQVIAR